MEPLPSIALTAAKMVADGGNLNTESLQGRSKYDSQQQSLGGRRNLIASIVTGIAAGGGQDAATATNAAVVAIDNNWLATQQIVQMKKELKAAQSTLDELKVLGKWGYISTKQDALTTSGVGRGLVESGWNDVKGLAEFLSDPIKGLNGLKEIIANPQARQQIGDAMFAELDAKIDRMTTALEVGGYPNSRPNANCSETKSTRGRQKVMNALNSSCWNEEIRSAMN